VVVRPGPKPDARVDRTAARGGCDDRIEIELCDLREVESEEGQPVKERGKRIGVGRRSAAIATDEPARLAAMHELVGVEIGERRDAEVGAAAADPDALAALLHRLSLLALDLPEVAELDLNPVIATPTGCVAVDARIRLRSRPEERSLKSW
jgi:hypothetical protein